MFDDMWHYTTQTRQMLQDFNTSLDEADISSTVKGFFKASIESLSHGTREEKGLVAYLVYMTERLILMKGVLKKEGSIYYHCDPTASHYIKIIMDGIFGRKNFVNEIIWEYKTGGVPSKFGFARKHDVIFFYKMTNKVFFNSQKEKSYVPTLPEPHTPSGKRLGIMRDGFCELCKTGTPSQKYRIVTMRDVWDDIPALFRNNRERRGYSTQKPVKLLERIISASCPSQGEILDPFCGCGTSCMAAEELKRAWTGVDISTYAVKEIEERLKEIKVKEKEDYELIRDHPASWNEYIKLNPYEKQRVLIKAVGGRPNERMSGDGGVDGDLRIHLGKDRKDEDIWGDVVFSVKTGGQASPVHIRELKGMIGDKYVMGCLILERDPTAGMETEAADAGQIEYKPMKDLPPEIYDKIQILTADDIINRGEKFNLPYSFQTVKFFREYSKGKLL